MSDAHVGRSKAELVAQRSFSERVVSRLAGSWRVAPRHATCWSHVPWARVCNRARRRLIAHRWLDQVAVARLARLFPVVGHWAGWSCITNGAYAGAPHEGNGYNGSYTGALGMSTPWAGYRPSTGDWVTAPRAEVYTDAEAEAARHRFGYAWMAGQWPETFPPCAGFFR